MSRALEEILCIPLCPESAGWDSHHFRGQPQERTHASRPRRTEPEFVFINHLSRLDCLLEPQRLSAAKSPQPYALGLFRVHTGLGFPRKHSCFAPPTRPLSALSRKNLSQGPRHRISGRRNVSRNVAALSQALPAGCRLISRVRKNGTSAVQSIARPPIDWPPEGMIQFKAFGTGA